MNEKLDVFLVQKQLFKVQIIVKDFFFYYVLKLVITKINLLNADNIFFI